MDLWSVKTFHFQEQKVYVSGWLAEASLCLPEETCDSTRKNLYKYTSGFI